MKHFRRNLLHKRNLVSFLKISLFPNSSTHNKPPPDQDQKFWEEFKKRKEEQKEIAIFNSEFKRTSPYEFKYSSNYTINGQQLVECIEDLDPRIKPNFSIIDLRSQSEIEEFRLPHRTKKLAYLPIIYREAYEILNHNNYSDFNREHHLILVDKAEKLAKRVYVHLSHEGYKVIYLYGGIIGLQWQLKSKKL